MVKDSELFFDLYAIPGMTEFRLKNLLKTFRTPTEIFAADRKSLVEIKGVDESLADAILTYRRSEETADRIKQAQRLGVRAISYLDKDFPANLQGVAHMPPVLFIRGEITDSDQLAVAVVGTRSPSHYGAQVAERLGKELAAAGVTVVSGLARGVDTWAHQGALRAKGRTIAVLGCGIDICYPPENHRLSEEIIKSGALLSEFPLGTGPLPNNFPKRNRIISALSRMVVAVEAGERSGVLNTCSWAKEQKRSVFAVPGRIGDEKSFGTNRLIKEGAIIITAFDDLLQRLGVVGESKKTQVIEVSESDKLVLTTMREEPIHIDEICESTGIPIADLLTKLFQLEVKGLVKQLPGKFFVRVV